jgi:hypothetical protein
VRAFRLCAVKQEAGVATEDGVNCAFPVGHGSLGAGWEGQDGFMNRYYY